jgi:hypothetical protein
VFILGSVLKYLAKRSHELERKREQVEEEQRSFEEGMGL